MMSTKNSLYNRCIAEGKQDLLAEWDAEKNAPLTAENVAAGSHKRIWWRCAEGHSWQSEVRVRFGGAKCPYCAQRSLCSGNNDLATLMPDIAAQWDYDKNGSLRPRDVLPGSSRYVWWRCEKGHSWRARIISRTNGSGCPICAGKSVQSGINDLSTMYPKIAGEWNTLRNGNLMPNMVTAYSNKKVWWRCKLGHEWQAVIAARTTQNSACPYCAGKRVLSGFNDLATVYPNIAAQWDGELNGNLTPNMVLPGSHKRVWWKCSDGHVWKAAVFSRTGKAKCGCPVCAGKINKRIKNGNTFISI